MRATSSTRYTRIYYTVESSNIYNILIILSFIKEIVIFSSTIILLSVYLLLY